MSTISPAKLGAGFAVATAIGLPLLITINPIQKQPTINVAFASTTPTMNTELPKLDRDERLLPDLSTDNNTNGCGMKKYVDVCSLEFVQANMPQYLQKSFE